MPRRKGEPLIVRLDEERGPLPFPRTKRPESPPASRRNNTFYVQFDSKDVMFVSRGNSRPVRFSPELQRDQPILKAMREYLSRNEVETAVIKYKKGGSRAAAVLTVEAVSQINRAARESAPAFNAIHLLSEKEK